MLDNIVAGSTIPMSKEQLLLLRKRMRYSQAQLAEILGYDGQAVSRWENGRVGKIPKLVSFVVRWMADDPVFRDYMERGIIN
jgi:hypothetical protein